MRPIALSPLFLKLNYPDMPWLPWQHIRNWDVQVAPTKQLLPGAFFRMSIVQERKARSLFCRTYLMKCFRFFQASTCTSEGMRFLIRYSQHRGKNARIARGA